MPNPTISIITTVYDAKDYLPGTVRSILAQTFRDFELLLVEDGSPNGCGELCDELARTDPRIRVFHKQNGGPASALNVGLEHARGAYIGFVDSDDLIEPTMFETLLGAIRDNGVRLAACNADAVDEHNAPVPGAGVQIEPTGRRDAMELLLDTFRTGGFYGLLCWNKLFDIRLFRDKGVRFDESMFFGDDASELHRVYDGEQVYCLPLTLYHYRRRSGQMTEAVFPPRKLDDLKMYWNWLRWFSDRPERRDYYRWAVAWYWKAFYLFWCQAAEAGNLKELKDRFLAHKKHLDSILPDILRCPYVAPFEKIRAVAFCAAPDLTYRLAAARGRMQKP
ncbi:MAG: glycosyltransferase family 2 protein [Gemmiger sp.]|uniref:glycosyltransferase family 2 protein n=1 Tax=Gemmiger sp. TaxID=2049027 RepID=UPI002E788438|nr:glycosyltransferase family 2 protein [Gemmiger sp.]MEE0800037.1 glycosyltransferase family 2 protein [Gemmiger sp.]